MIVAAAVAGALGAGALLPARRRLPLLAGLALVTLAAVGMALARRRLARRPIPVGSPRGWW